jgi:hypothetical protein
MPSLARLITSPGKTFPSKGEVDATWWTMTDLPRITKLTPTRLLANFVTSTNRTLVGLAAGCLSAKKVIVTLNRRLCGSAAQMSFGYSVRGKKVRHHLIHVHVTT